MTSAAHPLCAKPRTTWDTREEASSETALDRDLGPRLDSTDCEIIRLHPDRAIIERQGHLPGIVHLCRHDRPFDPIQFVTVPAEQVDTWQR
jgi:hypothetical protein